MSENVKVIVRCRPMNQKEISKKCDNIVEIGHYVVTVLNPSARSAPGKSFTFDSVYDGLSSTETIYDDICYSLVESTLEGYNGTIFAYGQTGCGKTYTMQDGSFENASHNGIIPRCFDHIFETISISSSVRYLALVSYLEIYNENIRDLLCGSESAGYLQNHGLKDLPGVGVTVPTLSSKSVMNPKECYNWLNLGNKNRITGATLMNDNSSRSHTIFMITLEQIQGTASSSSSSSASSTIRRGKLNLVDLAGSERQSKTGAFGERLKEATKINLSLSALGNVISALVDGKTKHVPYRDSKLTRLLQDSLGGNTKTVMISCISPADINYDETLSTLRYASRAKSIANKPRINEDPKDAQLRQYQEEILKLKQLLGESQQMETRQEQKLWLEGEKEKLRQTIIADMINSKKNDVNSGEIVIDSEEDIQLNARKKIDSIKQALIGGERKNDIQLRERHRKRKLEAQRHLSAIAHALSRVENEDRDLLQGHYASIQQEINIKNDRIAKCTQKIKILEREVADLNSEFQLDREDYLEEIRQLNRQIQFYNLLLNKVQPILRKNGTDWNPEKIMENSVWNDDQKTWILPSLMNSIRLPPANLRSAFPKPKIKSIEDNNNNAQYRKVTSTDSSDSDLDSKESPESYKVDILKNYFRTNRKIPDTRSNSSKVYVRDFVLRKATPLPLNEYRSPLLKNNAIKTDFGQGKTLLDTPWSSLCVAENKNTTDLNE